MQNYLNKGSLEAGKKSITPFDVPIQKRAEKSNAPGNDYDPLTNITCKIGDKACSAKHNSVIQRSGLFHPINEKRKVQSILKLQREYGNSFVQKVIAQNAIQRKSKIGQPGHIYKKEADRVAEQVISMPKENVKLHLKEKKGLQTKTLAEQIIPLIQEQAFPKEEEKKVPIMTKKLSDSTPSVISNLESSIQSVRGSGQPLPASERAFFEPRFGYDFSRVRIHTDANAGTLNRKLNAQAFTYGKDIYFGAGTYSPGTSTGRRVLAHELTHVVQQKSINTSYGGTIRVYQTHNTAAIQFQQFRDCTPARTGTTGVLTQNQLDDRIHGALLTGSVAAILSEIAIERIRGGGGTADERTALANHFGAPTPAQLNIIRRRFASIDRTLSNNRRVICNSAGSFYCRRGWCAYASCPSGYYIHLCPPFFQDPGCGQLYTSMVHEAAHIAGACNDVAPGGAYPPANAHNNSYSYEGFAGEIF